MNELEGKLRQKKRKTWKYATRRGEYSLCVFFEYLVQQTRLLSMRTSARSI